MRVKLLVIDEFVEQLAHKETKGDSIIVFSDQKNIREWLRCWCYTSISSTKKIDQNNQMISGDGYRIKMVTKDNLENKVLGLRLNSVGVVYGTHLTQEQVDFLKSRVCGDSYFTLIH